MSLLMPELLVKRLPQVTVEDLRAMKAKGIVLDVDNTLAIHGGQIPLEGAVEWAHDMRDLGYKVMILSNNFRKRVEPLAEKFGLEYESFACKPFPFGFLRIQKRWGLRGREIVAVGDQVYTDVLGAHLAGCKAILVEPISFEHEDVTIRLRRFLEKPVRSRYHRKEQKD